MDDRLLLNNEEGGTSDTTRVGSRGEPSEGLSEDMIAENRR
jgi:hypothetical protein